MKVQPCGNDHDLRLIGGVVEADLESHQIAVIQALVDRTATPRRDIAFDVHVLW